jgi:hypothetical protein
MKLLPLRQIRDAGSGFCVLCAHPLLLDEQAGKHSDRSNTRVHDLCEI